MKLVLGTTNPDKVREIRAILWGLKVDLLSLDSFPDVDPAWWLSEGGAEVD